MESYKNVLSVGNFDLQDLGLLYESLIVSSSSEDINGFKLGRTFDLIYINLKDKLSEYILNCIRLSDENTVWVFKKNSNLEFRAHKSKFLKIYKKGYFRMFRLNPKLVTNNKTKSTIVTCLYDIRTLEGSTENLKKVEDYLTLGSSLLSLEIPLVIYTEKKLAQMIMELRPKEYHNITKIIELPFEETEYYKHLDKVIRLQEEYRINNINVKKDTPRYVLLGYNKFSFMKEVINNNYFNSSHFIWIDFGVSHVAQNINSIRRWVYNIPDKIRMLEINPYIENNSPKDYFRVIYHNVAAGLFSGSGEYLLKYCELFREKLSYTFEEGWYQLDEGMMAMINRENEDLTDNYYGDYDNIINGYDFYFELKNNRTESVINSAFHKTLNQGVHVKAWSILQYLKLYTLYHETKSNAYISNYVVCNYYISNNKMLDSDIVAALTKTPLNLNLINSCKNNLKFYSNYSSIIKD